MTAPLRLATIATLAAAALSAHALVLSDNLGNPTGLFAPYKTTGASFTTPGSAYSLTSVTLDVWDSSFLTVTLRDDAQGAPGATLATLDCTTPAYGLATWNGGSAALAADHRYWIVATTTEAMGTYLICTSSRVGSGPGHDGGNYGSLGYTPMMRVEAQPVPEPAPLAALGVGAVGLLRRRMRKEAR